MNFLKKLFGRPSKMDVTAYNFHLAFKYLPEAIDSYNKGISAFPDLKDLSGLKPSRPEFGKLLKKTRTVASGVNGFPNLEIHLLVPPSNETMPEVAAIIVARDRRRRQATIHTMEYSIGGFAVCEPKVGEHNNTGVLVKNAEQFAAFCVNYAMKRFPKF